MRDLLLVIVFIGLVPFIFLRPWIGVLAWSWISYLNPHKLGWGFTHTLPVAMVIGGVTLVAMVMSQDKKGIPMTREVILLIALSVLFTISMPFAWVPDSAWEEWDKVMKILLFTFVTIMLIYGRDRIYALLLVIAASLGFYGVKGGVFVLGSGGSYRVFGPPDSFIGDNNALGLALIMVVPMIMVLARHAVGKRRKLWNAGGYVAVLLTMLAAVFTYSRGAMLGVATILPFMFMAARRKVLLALLIAPFAMAALSVAPEKLLHRESTISSYEEDNSAMQRIQAWGVAVNVALHSPLFGAGFKLEDLESEKWLRYANFLGQWHNRSRAAHSIYFQILGEHGITGLVLFVLLIYFTLRTLGKIKKAARASETHAWMADYAMALQIGLIGYAVTGAFLSLAYFDLFYAFVALSVIMQREMALSAAAVPTVSAVAAAQLDHRAVS